VYLSVLADIRNGGSKWWNKLSVCFGCVLCMLMMLALVRIFIVSCFVP